MNHPKEKRRWPWLLIGAGGAYLLLLLALVAVESSDPDASIQTFTDALWYSMVTLSTVGYGDLYPVTTAGRLLGFCFVLMSTGLLTFLIGAVASLLFAKLLPQFRLQLRRNQNWYIFPQPTQEALALAESLMAQDSEGICLFPADTADIPERCLRYHTELSQLLKKKGSGTRILFYLGPDSFQNESAARQALAYGYDIYCQCESEPDTLPQGLHLFNSFRCCARLYWQRFPVTDSAPVILIGHGRYAQELLESGLQINIRSPQSGIAYHLFGDWDNFRRNHPRLDTAVAVNDTSAASDRIFFHSQPWNWDEDLLLSAGRILLCQDDEAENLELLRQLRRNFPVPGDVYLRSDRDVPDAIIFGTRQQLFTKEMVLRSRLNHTAMTMHDIYRRSTGGSAPAWEELSEFLRQSNIAAADHLLTKVRILLQDNSISDLTPEICARAYQVYQAQKEENASFFREVEHLRWMRFHVLHNWRYAPVRNNARREHTMICDFSDLTPADQAKDDFAWEMLADLAKESS